MSFFCRLLLSFPNPRALITPRLLLLPIRCRGWGQHSSQRRSQRVAPPAEEEVQVIDSDSEDEEASRITSQMSMASGKLLPSA